MQANHLPVKIGVFVLTALSGFLLLYGLESWIAGMVSDPELEKNILPGAFMAKKIRQLGTAEVLALLPQIKFRWLALCAFAAWLLTGTSREITTDENALRWRIRLFFGLQLLYLPDLLKEISIRWQWANLYEPSLIPGLFSSEMPSIVFLQFAGLAAFGLSAAMVLSKWKTGSLPPALLSAGIYLCWALLLAVYQAGGSIDHAYASLHSGMLFMSLWMFINWKFPEMKDSGYRLFQAGIWACYFFSGLEKLFLSGIGWLNPKHFELLCEFHPGKFCGWFTSHPFPAGMALFLVLAFQLLSPLQWRFPRWGYVTAGIGLLFHLGTWLVLDVGGWQSPWIAMLVFLLPLNSNKPLAEEKTAA